RWRFVDSGADGTIRMEPNENATGLPESFSAVVWRSMEGPQAVEAGIEAYRNGEIPVADVTPMILDSSAGEGLEADLQTVSSPGSTMLIGMDYNQAPFDNPDVRRAIAQAIDRERWASEIMGGTFMPAESITPP